MGTFLRFLRFVWIQAGHVGEGHDPDVHVNLLHLCSMFEKVEENVLLAVSLGQKLKGTPRLLAEFLDNYVGRKGNAAPRLLVQGITPRRWKVVPLVSSWLDSSHWCRSLVITQ
jgi:hypothetical protein